MEELKLINKFPQEVIATDEVGRGPLGGPVVAGAVRIYVEKAHDLKNILKFLRNKRINDSKKLSSLERSKILKNLGVTDLSFRKPGLINFKEIKIHFITWDIDHDAIDKENILGASLRAMREAAESVSLLKKESTTVLIDGHMKFRWGSDSPSWNEIPLIKGDSKSLLIGLASIIAKEKRDSFMKEMHEIYPQYGFNSHFGYPTKQHQLSIKTHGPCAIHRKTFKGVKEHIRS